MPYCKGVMVSRFHAMIAALSAKQPVIVLGWSHKYKEVMDSFELGSLVYDYKQADFSIILNSIESIVEDDTEVTAKLNRHLEANLQSSHQQFAYLFNAVD
jgi:polysaccharide pyruvyl transferase WcaK-like protein